LVGNAQPALLSFSHYYWPGLFGILERLRLLRQNCEKLASGMRGRDEGRRAAHLLGVFAKKELLFIS
jgi:hypothetical protein